MSAQGAASRKDSDDWVRHAARALDSAGYRRGGARRAVMEYIGAQTCAVTAQKIDLALQASDAGIGRASVYRALDQLERLHLVQRLETGTGTASYEKVEPSGEHHHHLVCEGCGRLVPFEDDGLERAIEKLGARARFEVDSHEIVLRGRCSRCARQ